MTHPACVAIDWGTSSFRLWVLDRDGRVLAEESADHGMGRIGPADYPALLETSLERLSVEPHVPVVICGMVGAAQGWIEVPYLPMDADLTRLGEAARRAPGTRYDVRILPGLRQSEPPNVMRGEETQIAGFLSGRTAFSGTLCLPGTHCKWVRLDHGRISRFSTAMTGEAFALFAGQSVLRHGLAADGWDEEAFASAVRRVLDRPEAAWTALFEVRARGLLCGQTPEQARATLSGLLIGAELVATRADWQGHKVHLIGAPALARRYAAALVIAGAEAEVHEPSALTLAGLKTAGLFDARSDA